MAGENPEDGSEFRLESGRTLPAEQFAPARSPIIATQASDGTKPHLHHELLEDRLAGEAAPMRRKRFEFAGTLGVGASGQVFAVFDRDLQRQVAVKMLRSGDHPRDELLAFLDEARITALLQHPNVLPVHDLDLADDGQPYFAMSRIEGTSLDDRILESTIAARDAKIATPNAVVTILIAVCHAVAYAHSHGVVHQDIKPANILLGDFGEVLLLDWGSALRLSEGAKGTERLYGSPIYLSPEQARREYTDRRSDIYALGATLFHALTLRLPTWSDDERDFWDKKRRGVIDPLRAEEVRGVPPALMSIALKALAADPAARYQTVAALSEDLEHYQAGLAVSAHREPLRRILARWYRANRHVCWTAGAALAVLSVMAVFLYREQVKNSTAWRLVYEERFDGPLGERWAGITQGWSQVGQVKADRIPADDPAYFSLASGGITSKSRVDGYIDLVYQRPMLGDLRVEWEYTPLKTDHDLNCFIDGDGRASGYTIHVGGWGDPRRCVLTKGTDFQLLDHSGALGALTIGRSYHFLMQKEGNTISFAVDGLRIFDYVDADVINIPNLGSFGFDSCSESPSRIEDVRIYRRPLAQKTSPIAFGDKLMQMGHYDEAYAQLSELFDSYGGTELAPEALYRMALCSLHLEGGQARGLELLDRFQRDYPQHRLIPYCLYDRLGLARAAGETAVADRLLAELTQHRGHPILRKILLDLSDQEAKTILPLAVLRLEDEIYPLDAIERIQASIHKLKGWSESFGVPLVHTQFQLQLPWICYWFGRADLVEDLCHDDSWFLTGALLEQGKYDQLLQRFPWMINQRGTALIDSGHADQVVDKPEYAEDTRWLAACVLGRAEELLPTFSVRQRLEMLQRAKRYEEALPLANHNPTAHVNLLISLKRSDEALAVNGAQWVKTEILFAAGKYDELLAADPGDRFMAYRSVFALISHGEPQRGRELLERLRRPSVSYGDEEAGFGRYYLPMLLDNADGLPVDRRACLRDLLEHARYAGKQRPWHRAALVAGLIDEAGFAKQPFQVYLQCRLLIARGIRHELDHEWEQAAHDYRECLALPWYRSDIGNLTIDYLTWRIPQLGGHPP